ncbi:MAG TPA: hypothetical protein VKU02_30025 [Gemmataceae bacterium]|nr:hypothetical protein [Gemmataceae bacterium]
MLRKAVGAVVVLGLCLGVALADEISAIITKVDEGKVTFAESKGKGEKGPEKTLPVAKSVKVVKGKYNKETKKAEAGDEIDQGLKNKIFSDIPEKGLRAWIITDDSNKKITEIRVMGGKKKKDQ